MEGFRTLTGREIAFVGFETGVFVSTDLGATRALRAGILRFLVARTGVRAAVLVRLVGRTARRANFLRGLARLTTRLAFSRGLSRAFSFFFSRLRAGDFRRTGFAFGRGRGVLRLSFSLRARDDLVARVCFDFRTAFETRARFGRRVDFADALFLSLVAGRLVAVLARRVDLTTLRVLAAALATRFFEAFFVDLRSLGRRLRLSASARDDARLEATLRRDLRFRVGLVRAEAFLAVGLRGLRAAMILSVSFRNSRRWPPPHATQVESLCDSSSLPMRPSSRANTPAVLEP